MITKASNSRLVITDGTPANTVSLLVTTDGAHVNDWSPKGPAAATTVWASSPYQDGKHIISKTYDNIIDTFGVIINDGNQDAVIHDLRQFLILLERAIAYWKDEYNVHRYWLEVRGSCETEIRYAFAIDYVVPDIPNPFDRPFIGDDAGKATLDEIQLIIEHAIWTDTLEIGTPCTKISAGAEGSLGGNLTGNFVPVATEDDAYVLSTGVYEDDDDLYLGKVASASAQSGVRFKNITIPAGSTITQAFVVFTPDETDSSVRCNVKIYGEDSINPDAFSDYADFIARFHTTAVTLWNNISTWTDGLSSLASITPDIKSVIQELIDQVGWASGQDLVLLFVDNVSDNNAFRVAGDTDHMVTVPTLYVTWSNAKAIDHGILTPTCTRGPAVVPYWNSKLLTHAFYYDASGGGSWSANLVDIGLGDDDLLPAVPAVGDGLYCCIEDHGVTDPATVFTNIVINLKTAALNVTGVMAYISNGAGGWIAQVVQYHPNCPLLSTGVLGLNFITWALQAGWEVDTYNGIDGYWIKFEITALGGGFPTTAPEKENAIPIYSVMWPYIQISDEELHGDISAILDLLLSITTGQGFTNLMVSAKKYERTDSGQFVPYIALSTFQHAPKAHNTPTGGIDGATEIQTSETYIGWCYNWTRPGLFASTRLVENFIDVKTYAGRFRVFVRAKVNVGAAGVIGLSLRMGDLGSGVFDTPVVYNTGVGFQLFDFGVVSFPAYPLLGSAIFDTYAHIYGICSAACNIDLYDFIMMPVDEGCLEIITPNIGMDFDTPIKIVTSDYKQGPYAIRLYNNTPSGFFVINWDYPLYSFLRLSILGSFNLEPDIAYWLIFFSYDSIAAAPASPFDFLITPVLGKSQRYLLARGNE